MELMMIPIKLSRRHLTLLYAYLLYVDMNTVTSNNRNNFLFKAVADAEELPHIKDVGTVAKPNCSLASCVFFIQHPLY